jgi:hypothetical protein
MKCPHCLVEFHDVWTEDALRQYHADDAGKAWRIASTKCPRCSQFTFVMQSCSRPKSNADWKWVTEYTVHPLLASRPVPPEVRAEDAELAADFEDAARLQTISPKASAALSRRCLQHLIRTKARIRRKDLFKEIEALRQIVPSWLAEDLHYPREIGNAAAHPMHNKHTGEIVDVDPEEAEWSLSVLERLFDYFYVQPAKSKAMKDKLHAKKKSPAPSAPAP